MYLCEIVVFSRSRQYVADMSNQPITAYLDKLKQTEPVVVIQVKCWHAQSRTRYVEQPDGRHKIQRYTERIQSYFMEENFAFTSWKDVTEEYPVQLLDHAVIRATMSIRVQCEDKCTEKMLQDRVEELVSEHKKRDQEITVTVNVQLASFQEEMVGITDPTKKPFCLNSVSFWIWSLSGLTMGYRWWLDCIATRVPITIKKSICVTPRDPRHSSEVAILASE